LTEIPVPTLRELEQEYNDENNLDELCDAHNDLIKVIIEKEEELITSHREHIDQVVDIIKTDMSLLQIVDQPNSDIE
jgi:kinesin family protein 2/24